MYIVAQFRLHSSSIYEILNPIKTTYSELYAFVNHLYKTAGPGPADWW